MENREATLAEEAADWYVRVAEDASDAQRARLASWLKRSPRHVEEFLMVATTHQLLRGVDARREIDVHALLAEESAAILPLKISSTVRASRARHRLDWRWVGAAAACFALAALAFFMHDRQGRDVYATQRGEQRVVRLEDGSLLQLNTRSRVKVAYSATERHVRLFEGEAMFTVERDVARPFRVATRYAVVEAVGTQFNVYERMDSTQVSVIEGKVRVLDNGTEPALVSAGEELQVRNDGHVEKRASPNVADAIAWRQRRLSFHGATLEEVAREFNRYNELQIRVEAKEGAPRRITAVFDADQPQALIEFLEHDPSVRVQHDGNEVRVSTE